MTWTRLHEAAERLDLREVLVRTRQNSDEAVCVDEHGSTPLHIACWHSQPSLELLQTLIRACPQTVSSQDCNGDTPLHIALSHPHANPDIVDKLLETNPTIASMPNHEGLMPLHQACRYCPSNETVMGLLLDVYPYATRNRIKMGQVVSRKKRTALDPKETDHAILPGTSPTTVINAFDLRFRHDSVQVRDGSYPLHMALAAASSGTAVPCSVVQALIVEAPEILFETNKFGETPLHVALSHNCSDDVVEALLQAASQTIFTITDKQEGNTLLHTAAANGCSAYVAKLLMTKCPPKCIHQENACGKTPLEVALEHGKCSESVLRLWQISDEAE